MGKAEGYLNQIPMWTRKKNSLEDVRMFLNELGDPDRRIPAIHVAGTNGKGSVCAFLSSVLTEAGYRTGTFISPHLVEVRERFLINGRMVDESVFEESFERVHEASRRMLERGFCHPTFFEFLFYMAMVIFEKEKVDAMVLETGMGGRLDTTNVLEHPQAAVITSISMDHTKYLGDTIEKIAGEKAGIIKNGVPVIFDDSCPQVSAIIEGAAFRKGAARYPVGRQDFQVEGIGEAHLDVNARMKDRSSLKLQIPFEALYQAQNAMLAVRTLDVLRTSKAMGRISEGKNENEFSGMIWKISDEQIRKGIQSTSWPGRMEQVRKGIYLDGAHNPGGISAFVQTAGEIRGRQGKKAYLLFAAVSDKDYEMMAEELCKGLPWSGIGVVHINSDRGLSAGVLAELFRKKASCPVVSYEDTAGALEDMTARAENDLLFCVGSLYLIGEIKAVLQRPKDRSEHT